MTLGAKGAGEAGTGGVPWALMNAVNDALRPSMSYDDLMDLDRYRQDRRYAAKFDEAGGGLLCQPD